MNVGAKGSIDDGLADITLLEPISPIEQVSSSCKLYNGTIHELKQAQQFQSTHFMPQHVKNETVKIELDGECGGILPKFQILPKNFVLEIGKRISKQYCEPKLHIDRMI